MHWEIALGYIKTDPPGPEREASLARLNAELASGSWEPFGQILDTFGIIVLLRRRVQ